MAQSQGEWTAHNPQSHGTRVDTRVTAVCMRCGGILRKFRDGSRGAPYWAHADKPLAVTANHEPVPVELPAHQPLESV